MLKYYEDYALNRTIEIPVTYKVTEEEVIRMAEKWDPQPFHMDKEAARQSIFGGLVASSAHIIPMFIWLGQQEGTRTAAVSALGFEEMKTLLPIRPGDVISYRYECTAKRLSKSRMGVGIVKCEGRMYNQAGELVFTGTVASLVKTRTENGKG
jgi:acyl dehydratase